MKLFTNLLLKKESEDEIFSMATLRKSRSKLPVNLYLDDAGLWKKSKHNLPRIKFQKNKNDTSDTRRMIPMSISKDPEVLIDLKRVRGLDLTSSDIKSVKNFVITNYDLLMDLSNEKIDFITFTELMK